MTDTERMVTWGLLGLIAYELWSGSGMGQCSPPTKLPSMGDQAPDWVSQLGESLYGENLLSPSCGIFGRCS